MLMETLPSEPQCEAHPFRNLNVKEWFRRGQDLFDIDDSGWVLHRGFGHQSNWHRITTVSIRSYAFRDHQLESAK